MKSRRSTLAFTSLTLTFEALNEVEARRTMACVAGAIRPLVEDVNVFVGR